MPEPPIDQSALTHRPPPPSSIRTDTATASYREQLRGRDGISTALKQAVAGLVIAAVTGLTVAITNGTLFGAKGEKAEAREAREKAKKAHDDEMALLREAVLGANGRSTACAVTVNAQAEWIRSYLRQFERVATSIDGDQREPALLGIAPPPLSSAPLVIEVGPPRVVITTPIPTLVDAAKAR